ncbi:MAG: PDZ domain-containing protein, partial [Chitinophagaceae bacterium]
ADIIKYGSTKRAYLGVMFGNGQSDEEQAKTKNVDGVYIVEVSKGSAAAEAGLQKGDVITGLNGAKITTGTQVIERIAAMRPGEKVMLTYNRDGADKTVSLTLKGEAGTYTALTGKAAEQLGANFENLSKEKAAELGLTGGVQIKSLKPGILREQTRIREGFVVTKVNGKKISTTEELTTALKAAGSSAIISGVYPSQPQREYQYALNDLG